MKELTTTRKQNARKIENFLNENSIIGIAWICEFISSQSDGWKVYFNPYIILPTGDYRQVDGSHIGFELSELDDLKAFKEKALNHYKEKTILFGEVKPQPIEYID